MFPVGRVDVMEKGRIGNICESWQGTVCMGLIGVESQGCEKRMDPWLYVRHRFGARPVDTPSFLT